MVAVTSCLGGFLGFRHTNTSLPCPALPYRAFSDLEVCRPGVAYGSSHVHCHCRIETFRCSDVEKSIILPRILEAFHGARQLAVVHEQTLRLLGTGCQCCCALVGDFYEPPGTENAAWAID